MRGTIAKRLRGRALNTPLRKREYQWSKITKPGPLDENGEPTMRVSLQCRLWPESPRLFYKFLKREYRNVRHGLA